MDKVLLEPFIALQLKPPLALSDWALFLDVDGTLLDLAATPSSVVVPPQLVVDLRAASDALGGALAVVSGRPLMEIDALLNPLRLPAAGEHGAVIRFVDGRRSDIDVEVPENWLTQVSASLQGLKGVVIERKTRSMALHFRGAPQTAQQVRRIAEALVALDPVRFEVLEARMAVEIRARAATKAHAVRSLMAESPFTGRFPIYVGDDRTDEEGIRAVHAMGGIGFLVDVAFDGHPHQVRRWLHAIGRGDHTTEAR